MAEVSDNYFLLGSIYFLLGILLFILTLLINYRSYIIAFYNWKKIGKEIDIDSRNIVFIHFVPKFLEASVNQRNFQDEITDVILTKQNLSYSDFMHIAKRHRVDEDYVNKLLTEVNRFQVFDIKNNSYSLTKKGEVIFKYVRLLLDLALVNKSKFFENMQV